MMKFDTTGEDIGELSLTSREGMKTFVIADVFTGSPFGGNQLAVFPDAQGLSDRAMQKLAREFNFAESAFVLPPTDPRCIRRVRIFTPAVELPFAGHPTIGTAAVLAAIGVVDASTGPARIVLEERVGAVNVEVHSRGEAVDSRLTLPRAPESPEVRPRLAAVSAALSLAPSAVEDAWFASVGAPFCFARLKDRSAVDSARLDRIIWSRHFARAWSPHLFFFTGGTGNGSRLHARMFGPAMGIEEDPATGAACAALAGTLATRSPAIDGTFAITVDQGVALGRPSVIEATAVKKAGSVISVGVGGTTVITGHGRMIVPSLD
jgi:trans-2,3-dihydro-3-hydroxyanthranilate isomerase